MKTMKSLSALYLSAAFIPALALSTSACAAGGDYMKSGKTMMDDMQGASSQYINQKPDGGTYAHEVIGTSVMHRGSNEEIGTIRDLVIDDQGRVVGVLVTTSSFLGLGGREVGLSWDQLQHTMQDNESVFYVDIDEDTLRNAPEHTRE